MFGVTSRAVASVRLSVREKYGRDNAVGHNLRFASTATDVTHVRVFTVRASARGRGHASVCETEVLEPPYMFAAGQRKDKCQWGLMLLSSEVSDC